MAYFLSMFLLIGYAFVAEVVIVISVCPTLNSPCQGNVSFVNGTFSGSEASFTCGKGYVINGSDVITCENNTWSAPVPACLIIDCELPPLPPNGSLRLISGTTTYGSVALLACNTGFEPENPEYIHCDVHGWTNRSNECQMKSCPSGDLLIIPNGILTPTADNITDYGSKALVTCNVGYVVSGDNVTECEADGRWSEHGSCVEKDCGQPVVTANISLTYVKTTFSSIAIARCPTGYDVDGSTDIITCGSDGLWRPEIKCVKLAHHIPECPAVDPPTNGNISFSNGPFNGSVGTFRCKEGYTISGAQSITCSNGTWSGQKPVCEHIDCGSPVPTAKSTVTYGETKVGSKAIVGCTTGYEIDGATDMMTCRNDFTWNPGITCFKTGCPTGDSMTFSNGVITLNVNDVADYGSTALVTCNVGYVLIGGNITVCQADKTWSAHGSCEKCTNPVESTGDPPQAYTIAGTAVAGLIVGIIVGVGSMVVYMRQKSPVLKSGTTTKEITHISTSSAKRGTESGRIAMTDRSKPQHERQQKNVVNGKHSLHEYFEIDDSREVDNSTYESSDGNPHQSSERNAPKAHIPREDYFNINLEN